MGGGNAYASMLLTKLTERRWQMLTGSAAMSKTFEACGFVLLQINLSWECPMYKTFSRLSHCLKTNVSDVLPLSVRQNVLNSCKMPSLTRFCFSLLSSITSISGSRDVESEPPPPCLFIYCTTVIKSNLINIF